ncbi:MAG: hypothetical protein ABI857_00200 [Acidobacteriota bacterium]
MFLSIRKFSNVKSHDEVIKKVREELFPTLKKLPGFVNYYATKFEDGDLGAISMFNTKAEADKAADTATDWIKQNLATHLPSEPMVLRGDVLFSTADKTIGASA